VHTGAAGGILRHRRCCGVAIQDRRHRAATQETADDHQTADPVVWAVGGGGGGKTEEEDVRGRRGGEARAADRFGPARRRTAGRQRLVAHQERLAPEGRDIQHAQAPEAVQLVGRGTAPDGRAVEVTVFGGRATPDEQQQSVVSLGRAIESGSVLCPILAIRRYDDTAPLRLLASVRQIVIIN